MSLSELRALLELLKDFGVTEYSHDGLALKLAQSGSLSVVKHANGEAHEVPEVQPHQVDPQARAMWEKLSPQYKQLFPLGA